MSLQSQLKLMQVAKEQGWNTIHYPSQEHRNCEILVGRDPSDGNFKSLLEEEILSKGIDTKTIL